MHGICILSTNEVMICTLYTGTEFHDYCEYVIQNRHNCCNKYMSWWNDML